MEIVVVLVVGAVAAVVGIVLGFGVAPRIDRWQQEREGPDDDAQ